MTKTKKSFRLKKDAIQKIEQLANEKNISQANAIEIMAEKYFEDREKNRIAF